MKASRLYARLTFDEKAKVVSGCQATQKDPYKHCLFTLTGYP